MNKICSGCSRLLDLENFSLRKRTPDGLNGRCKECIRRYAAEKHLERRNRPANVEKRKLKSEEVLLRRKNRVSTFNKKEYQKQYQALNRERLNAACKSRRDAVKCNKDFIRRERVRSLIYYYNNKDKFRATEAKRYALKDKLRYIH